MLKIYDNVVVSVVLEMIKRKFDTVSRVVIDGVSDIGMNYDMEEDFVPGEEYEMQDVVLKA